MNTRNTLGDGDVVALTFAVSFVCRCDHDTTIREFTDAIRGSIYDAVNDGMDDEKWDLRVGMTECSPAMREEDEHPERPR